MPLENLFPEADEFSDLVDIVFNQLVSNSPDQIGAQENRDVFDA